MQTGRKNIEAVGGFVFVLALAILLAWTAPRDPDLWYHLATGRLIAQSHAIPRVDTWTHTAAGCHWVTHEWLYEVLLFGLYQLGGLKLVVGLRVACVALTLWICERTAAAGGVAARVRYPLLIIAGCLSAERFTDRPQVVTFLAAAVALNLLERARRQSAAPPSRGAVWRLAWLVPLAWGWANMHAGVIYLLALCGAYGLGQVCKLLWQGGVPAAAEPGSIRGRARLAALLNDPMLRTLTLVTAAALGAVLLSPNHLAGLLYGFETTAKMSAAGFTTLELLPAHGGDWDPGRGLVAGLMVAAVLLARRRPLHEVILILAFGFWAWRWLRERATFFLVLLPIYAGWAEILIRRLDTMGNLRLRLASRTLALAGLYGLALWLAVGMPVGNRRLDRDPLMPESIVRFHQAQQLPSRVFNVHAWGSYLIWAVDPGRLKVFIDARLDVFPGKVLTDYLSIMRGDIAILDTYDIDCCLVDYSESYTPRNGSVATARLAARLFSSPEWVLVHWNDEGMIYLRRAVYERDFAALTAWRAVDPNLREFTGYVSAGMAEAALAELRLHTAAQPDDVRSRRFLGHMLLADGRWAEAAETFRTLAATTGLAADVEALYFALERIGQAN